MQETFLRAWKASATFQGRSSVRTWLYRIATNVCLTNLEDKPQAAAAGRARHARPDGRRRAGAGPRDRLARAGPRRRGRGRRAGLDPARVRRRAPAPAGPAARRTDPARRAALVGRRGRRGARHHRRGGQLRAPARPRPAGRARPHRGHRRARPDDRAARPARRVRRRVLAQGHRPDRQAAQGRGGVGDAAVHRLVRRRREHRPADRHPVPRRRQRHADDRDPRQRAAGVRALHAHARGRLHAVPPPGARASTATGSGTSTRSSSPGCSRCSGCRPGCRSATSPATRSRPTSPPATTSRSGTAPDRRDHRPRDSRGRSSCSSGRSATPGWRSPRSGRTTCAAPTPCAGWTLARLLAHMEDALDAFTEAAAGHVAVTPAPPTDDRVDALREKACALLGAWADGATRRGRGGRPRPRARAAGRYGGAGDHRPRLGRRPGDRARARRSRTRWPRGLLPVAERVVARRTGAGGSPRPLAGAGRRVRRRAAARLPGPCAGPQPDWSSRDQLWRTALATRRCFLTSPMSPERDLSDACALVRAGELTDGIEILLALRPTTSSPRPLTDVDRATLLATLLECRLARGDLAEAMTWARSSPTSSTARAAAAIAHQAKGELSAALGHPEVALEHFTRAGELAPDASIDVLPWRGGAALAHLRAGNSRGAAELARAHVRGRPGLRLAVRPRLGAAHPRRRRHRPRPHPAPAARPGRARGQPRRAAGRADRHRPGRAAAAHAHPDAAQARARSCCAPPRSTPAVRSCGRCRGGYGACSTGWANHRAGCRPRRWPRSPSPSAGSPGWPPRGSPTGRSPPSWW